MIQIKAVKPTKFYPVVGKVYDVEPSPRVRVLMHKGYIVKVERPVTVLENGDLRTEVSVSVDGVYVGPGKIVEAAEAVDMAGDAVATDEDGLPILAALEDDAPGEPDEDDEDPDDDV